MMVLSKSKKAAARRLIFSVGALVADCPVITPDCTGPPALDSAARSPGGGGVPNGKKAKPIVMPRIGSPDKGFPSPSGGRTVAHVRVLAVTTLHDGVLGAVAPLGLAAAVETAVAHECALLESVFGGPISTISFHRPVAERAGSANRLAGRLNAYGPRFVKDMGYCSDSRGAWQFGGPLEQPAVREKRALQLLVHPFWWQDPPTTPVERLKAFVEQRKEFLDHELARHCAVHKAHDGH